MRLDRGTISEIALRLKESKNILERAHHRISQSLEGLATWQETATKATAVLRDVSAPGGDSQAFQK